MPALRPVHLWLITAAVAVMSVAACLVYLWGYPQSGDKRFHFILGPNEYVIHQSRDDLLPFPYSSRLYAGNSIDGYRKYYLEHEDFYWWTASMQQNDASSVTIIKNGKPIAELDLTTSETTHFYNGSKRDAMDRVASIP